LHPPDSPPDRILKVRRRLFFAHGFESVSTDAVVREAGVSKATLYKCFPNMRVVLKAVTEAEADSFQANVRRDVNGPVACLSVGRGCCIAVVRLKFTEKSLDALIRPLFRVLKRLFG